jgi:hypothetical protein
MWSTPGIAFWTAPADWPSTRASARASWVLADWLVPQA